MKVYFDTEFTGLHKDTTLVSIGLVSDDNKTFYAELNDFDRGQMDDWFIKNVLSNLVFKDLITSRFGKHRQAIGKTDVADKTVLCSKEELKRHLTEYFSQFNKVTLVSDVCHYDMVLLIDIFGSAFDLPKHVSACCHDINQDIASILRISEIDAFDFSREELVLRLKNQIEEDGYTCREIIPKSLSNMKHNSLYDAYVIKQLYDYMTIIKSYRSSWE